MHNLFIQLTAHSTLLESIIKTITPRINTIIKEELGLDTQYKFDFFLPKKRQVLTVYYLQDCVQESESSLFKKINLVEQTNACLNDDITLRPVVEFFGGSFGINDELVIMIDDPQETLLALNKKLKIDFHTLNDEYKRTHAHNLYNVAKSEQYGYVPHIGLGRIRSTSILERSNTRKLAAIQKRIKQDIAPIIAKLFATHNAHLLFDAMAVFDPQKRTGLTTGKPCL